MAQALFITRDDVVKFTAMNGNVDTDKFIQFVKIAQDIHILNYLGSDLYNKINDDIVNQTISGNYLSLLTNYIKPMLIHFAMAEYLPFAAYTIANKGVYKHSSENAENVEKVEVDFLIQKELSIADNYVKRFHDYMCVNYTLFPEYTSNTTGDVYPDKKNGFHGWYF
jgi:hypothetical protein